MKKNNEKKYLHLTYKDRSVIHEFLNYGYSFTAIGNRIHKDRTTVAKEVKSHRFIKPFGKSKEISCPNLNKAPYVCNGCTKKINHCMIAHKYYYNGRAADRKYRELLISSRSGINMTKLQLHQKDQIISPLIEQGQSHYQILTNHPELDMSVRSMYTYIDKGLFTARNIDLKRQAKFKPRKCHKTQITDCSVFTDRTYSDFCSLDLSSFVEMDAFVWFYRKELLLNS